MLGSFSRLHFQHVSQFHYFLSIVHLFQGCEWPGDISSDCQFAKESFKPWKREWESNCWYVASVLSLSKQLDFLCITVDNFGPFLIGLLITNIISVCHIKHFNLTIYVSSFNCFSSFCFCKTLSVMLSFYCYSPHPCFHSWLTLCKKVIALCVCL